MARGTHEINNNWDTIVWYLINSHDIFYLKRKTMIKLLYINSDEFSVFNLWNLKRPISQKKEFWTKLFKRVKKNVPWKTYCSVDYHRKVHQSLCCFGEIVPKKIGIQKSDDHYFNSRKKYSTWAELIEYPLFQRKSFN